MEQFFFLKNDHKYTSTDENQNRQSLVWYMHLGMLTSDILVDETALIDGKETSLSQTKTSEEYRVH